MTIEYTPATPVSTVFFPICRRNNDVGFQSPVVLQKQLSVVYATFSMKSLNMENVECHFGGQICMHDSFSQISAGDLPFNAMKIVPFLS